MQNHARDLLYTVTDLVDGLQLDGREECGDCRDMLREPLSQAVKVLRAESDAVPVTSFVHAQALEFSEDFLKLDHGSAAGAYDLGEVVAHCIL